MEKIKVMIADDSDFVRDGMRIILSVDPEFEVIGCASNGREVIELAKKTAPDIFLMDIQMPEMDGIEATKYIVEQNLGKVLILTTFDDDELVQQALRSVESAQLPALLSSYSSSVSVLVSCVSFVSSCVSSILSIVTSLFSSIKFSSNKLNAAS